MAGFLLFLFSLSLPLFADSCRTTAIAFAESLGLHYLESAGKRGKRFIYLDADGKQITNKKEIERMRNFGLPKGYQKVWHSSDPKSHIQFTVENDRGKVQYRYHPNWVEARNEAKYEHLPDFGHALIAIRKGVAEALKQKAFSEEKLLAAVIRLMDLTSIRVGNKEYAQENETYGLTTLLGQHVRVIGNKIFLKFTGKDDVDHSIVTEDAEIAAIIRENRSGPDDPIFFPITSDDINDYLRELSEMEISAKYFRTWGGSVTALAALRTVEQAEAIAAAAKRLGNTPGVCRDRYIHPRILSSDKSTIEHAFKGAGRRKPNRWLNVEEQALLILLESE